MRDFRPAAQALRPELVALRRDFHQHPELAFKEVRTAGIVAQYLQQLGLEVQAGVGQTGVVAILEGDQPGPTILVRCDMDALPILEATQHEFPSQTPQQMHACGHDGHTAIGLGLAKLLSAYRQQIKGRVKFIFQPAEEIGMGAKTMLADGAFADPTPSMTFGLHVWPDLPVGEIILSPGALMAGAAIVDIELHGRGGHAARPQGLIDPIVAGAHLVTALQTLVSRNIDPTDTAVLSITQFQAGSSYNVIPPSASLKGTFRTFTPSAQAVMLARLEEMVAQTAQAFGCTAALAIDVRVPPVYNDVAITQRLQAGFAQALPDLTYHTDPSFKTMEAEDVAFFLQQAPGTFLLVGSGYSDKEKNFPLHHPQFDLNEDVLVLGAALLASAVSDYVLE